MANVGIVADDLTGGTTVGALIAREGVPATVFFDPSYVATTPLPDNAAAIVSTDSRPLSAGVAFGRVRDATRILEEQGARMFAKRIDTTVRGGVGPEVEGMLSALGSEYMAVVVPAMPQSRRVVIEGYSLIDSVLLTRTGVAQDVRTPVHQAHLPTLFREQFKAGLGHVSIRPVISGRQAIKHELVELRREGTRIFLVDALSIDDVDQIAQAVVDLGWPIVCVDPGPFTDRVAVHAGAIRPAEVPQRVTRLDPVPGETGTVLVVAGSATRVTHNQITRLAEAPGAVALSVDVLAMLDRDVSAHEAECRRAEAEARRLLDEAAAPPRVMICALDTVYSGTTTPKAVMEELSGLTGPEPAKRLTVRFGALARRVLDVIGKRDCAGLYLTGGDVMVAGCEAFGAKGITLVDYVIPQVDQGIITGGPYEGLPVVCKGGLTGTEVTAVQSVNRILDERMRTHGAHA